MSNPLTCERTRARLDSPGSWLSTTASPPGLDARAFFQAGPTHHPAPRPQHRLGRPAAKVLLAVLYRRSDAAGRSRHEA
jgi:hypothetical protein